MKVIRTIIGTIIEIVVASMACLLVEHLGSDFEDWIIGVVGVLFSLAWINAGVRMRERYREQIILDWAGFFKIPVAILVIALVIALVMVWVSNGFGLFLKMLGSTIVVYVLFWILCVMLCRFFWAREGVSIIIQILGAVASVIYLMIIVF